MSLINQMLQDLDRRHVNVAGSIPLETVRVGDSANSAIPAAGNSHRLAIAVASLFLCAGAGWYASTHMHMPIFNFVRPARVLQAEVISSANANVQTKVQSSPQPVLEKKSDGLNEQLVQIKQQEEANAAELQAKIDEINQLKMQLQQMAEEASDRHLPTASNHAVQQDTPVPVKSKLAINKPSASINKFVGDSASLTPVLPTSEPVADAKTIKQASVHETIESKAGAAKLAATKISINKQISPEQEADYNYGQALSMMQLGRASEAQPLLAKALALNPANRDVRLTLVGVLVDLKRSAEAIDCLKEGLQLDPQQTGFSQILARLLVENNQRSEAMAVLMKALPYAHEDAQYHAFLAALLQRDDQHKEAIEHYLIALKQHGNQASWLVGLGISLQAEGRMQEARDIYAKAQGTQLNADLAQFVDQRLKQVQQQIN